MGLKGLPAGLIVFSAMSIGLFSSAASMSLDEFYRLDRLEKENFMTTVLHFFHNRYTQDPTTSHRAACMVDLYNPSVAGDDPKLLSMIMRDMDRARANAGRDPTVEKVVETVVERECDGG